MDIGELVNLYVSSGYELADALAKVSQDIILLKISRSSLNNHITIKGGVVMHNISKDKRRATRDMDFDFIKYSLSDESIKQFIEKLNKVNDGINININGNIEELHHQDYDGKRVYITLIDTNNYRIDSKLDIGVHKDFDIEQEEYCFDLDTINESVTLLINSKEQIFTEKLKSLLRFAYTSTRYKDIFDFYYLIKYGNLNKTKLEKYINKIIFNDKSIRVNNFKDIYKMLKSVFNNRRFASNLNNVKVNWLDISSDEAVKCILEFIDTFEVVAI